MDQTSGQDVPIAQNQTKHNVLRDGATFQLTESNRYTTQFRVWATRAKQVDLQIVQRNDFEEAVLHTLAMTVEGKNCFVVSVDDCPPGTLYRYQIDGGPGRPDPFSRFQPFGVHGPSQVIDPHRYQWNDQDWQGVDKRDLVIYEMHVGSFTEAGTYQAATEKLPQLVKLGITAIELLPLAQTPGRWNWGYDGVNLFAPRNNYGTPDDLKYFIDTAHQLGLAVILDVVYNHIGPEGNYLNEFAHYRSTRHATPWGDALNYDGKHSRPVRDFVIQNGLFWLDEYHFDGLRLDAIHYMFDDSEVSIVDEFRAAFRNYQRQINRKLWLIAESNIFDDHLVDQANGTAYDAIWSDCLMHSLYSHGIPELRLTNRHYIGTKDVVESLQYGYVFTFPQAKRVQTEDRKQRSQATMQYKNSLVMALQTHDSVGNHPHGLRLHQLTSLEFQMAAAPLILLYPSMPMIFMGEEFAANSPFPFFADFEDPNLRKAVDRGRRDEYPHHDWNSSPLPSDPSAFHSSKLDFYDLDQPMAAWYQSLLTLRRQGLNEGWLSVAHKSFEFDADQDLFQLIFADAERKFTIASRLAPEDSAEYRLSMPNRGQLLLNSADYSTKSSIPVPSKDDRFADRTDDPRSQNEAIDLLTFGSQHCYIWVELKN